MKLKRVDVLAMIDKAEATLKKQYEDNDSEAAIKYEKSLAQWTKVHAPKWEEAAKEILAALKKGQPIRVSMLPKPNAYSGYNYATFEGRAPTKTKFIIPAELRGLRAMIDACTDDIIDLPTPDMRKFFNTYA